LADGLQAGLAKLGPPLTVLELQEQSAPYGADWLLEPRSD
jgi:hypothetical protein